MTTPPPEPGVGSTPGRHGGRITHQPALDGLRGLAVLLVLIFHDGLLRSSPGGLRGGALGVDIFFVLSGFLITSLLFAERATTGGIAIGSFWARRARRLLPALFVLLLGVAFYATTVASPTELGQIRGDAIATLLYVQNWHLIAGGTIAGGSVLNHAWSLSVEEQWYVVWPVAVAALLAWKRFRPAGLLALILVLAAMSAIWTTVLFRNGAGIPHVYWGTDTRAQELLVGAALAVALPRLMSGSGRRRRIGLELLGLAGGAITAAIVVTTSGLDFLAHGGYALLAFAVVAVIAASVQPSSPIVRPVLSVPPLRYVGLISYGLYLYHWPLFFVLSEQRTHLHGVPLLLLRFGLSILVATVSFLVIERPIRRGALSGPQLRLAAPIAVAIVVAALLFTTRGAVPANPTKSTASQLLPTGALEQYRRTSTRPGARILVVGHGLAFQLQLADDHFTRGRWNAMAAGFLDCSFVPGSVVIGLGITPEAQHCQGLLPALQRLRGTFRPDAIVLIPEAQELFDRKVGPYLLRVGTPAWEGYAAARLDAAIQALATDRTPVFLADVPCNLKSSVGDAFDPVTRSRQRLADVNRFLDRYAAARPQRVTRADLAGLLCSDGVPSRSVHGRTIVDPDGKLTPAGTRLLWGWAIDQVKASPPRDQVHP